MDNQQLYQFDIVIITNDGVQRLSRNGVRLKGV